MFPPARRRGWRSGEIPREPRAGAWRPGWCRTQREAKDEKKANNDESARHRADRRMVWLAPILIALGHALSVALIAVAFVWAGLVVDARLLRVLAGLALIGWALYHWRYGHRHRVRSRTKTLCHERA